MVKDIMEYTREDFLQMERFYPRGTFNQIVIVPTDEVHDSGFRCMRFILFEKGEIVGVVSGWSDVIHINGIGGFGIKGIDGLLEPKAPIGWRIDCLPESGCIRLFSDKKCTLKDEFVGSDFVFYVKE